MPTPRLVRPALALLILATHGGCSDDTAGTGEPSSSSSSTGAAPSTGGDTEPTTGPRPTTGDDGGLTDAGTAGATTTGAIDPTTGATDPGTSTTTGETTDAGSSSTGAACEDGVTCDGDIAVHCVDGVEMQETCARLCIDGVGCDPCTPGAEVCDGVDNNCDGLADEGDVCGPGSCSGGGGNCVELAIPPIVPLASACEQLFPPIAGHACPIAEPGPQFHVSAATGSDGNDGKTPATAWASLCHAVDAAPAGSTLRVAAGQYASASVYIGKQLTVKGGYDDSFTTWDPDLHPTLFHGRLHLDHNGAVFGGFRMISNPVVADAWSYAHHFVGAGTLVRNYIEIVAAVGDDPDLLNFYGIVPSACPGGVSVLRCNDIYVRASAPQTFVVSAVEYGNHALHAGHGVLDANRICQDGGGWATDAVGGYGSCFPAPASLLVRNNVIEKVGPGGGAAVNFYSCGSGDMSFELTNNTVLSSGDGIRASGDPGVMMRWRLTNNIVRGTAGGEQAVDLGLGGVELTASENNLTFGFASNTILPPALVTGGDDTTGVATAASVFVGSGDLHLMAGGQGVDTGLNVHSLPAYGFVTADIEQSPRPANGAWDRGAYLHVDR